MKKSHDLFYYQSIVIKGVPDIKRPYISNLGWVGFGVGFEKIYRAIQFNVNAIIAEIKSLSRNFLVVSIFT